MNDSHRRCPTCNIILVPLDDDFDVRAFNRLAMAATHVSQSWTTVRQLDSVSQEQKNKLAEAKQTIDDLFLFLGKYITDKRKSLKRKKAIPSNQTGKTVK